MQVKMFEIRDYATFFPVICIKPGIDDEGGDEYLLKRSGYDLSESRRTVIMMHGQEVSRCEYNPFNWGDRTFHNAHLHIKENWEKLNTGDVIDVEFILGESKEAKTSERYIIFGE